MTNFSTNEPLRIDLQTKPLMFIWMTIVVDMETYYGCCASDEIVG